MSSSRRLEICTGVSALCHALLLWWLARYQPHHEPVRPRVLSHVRIVRAPKPKPPEPRPVVKPQPPKPRPPKRMPRTTRAAEKPKQIKPTPRPRPRPETQRVIEAKAEAVLLTAPRPEPVTRAEAPTPVVPTPTVAQAPSHSPRLRRQPPTPQVARRRWSQLPKTAMTPHPDEPQLETKPAAAPDSATAPAEKPMSVDAQRPQVNERPRQQFAAAPKSAASVALQPRPHTPAKPEAVYRVSLLQPKASQLPDLPVETATGETTPTARPMSQGQPAESAATFLATAPAATATEKPRPTAAHRARSGTGGGVRGFLGRVMARLTGTRRPSGGGVGRPGSGVKARPTQPAIPVGAGFDEDAGGGGQNPGPIHVTPADEGGGAAKVAAARPTAGTGEAPRPALSGVRSAPRRTGGGAPALSPIRAPRASPSGGALRAPVSGSGPTPVSRPKAAPGAGALGPGNGPALSPGGEGPLRRYGEPSAGGQPDASRVPRDTDRGPLSVAAPRPRATRVGGNPTAAGEEPGAPVVLPRSAPSGSGAAPGLRGGSPVRAPGRAPATPVTGPRKLGTGAGQTKSSSLPKSSPEGLYRHISASFEMPIIAINGLDYDCDPHAVPNVMRELSKRTNIRATVTARDKDQHVALVKADVNQAPVIYFVGHNSFKLTEEERQVLRDFVAGGGTILGNNSNGPFDQAFQREMFKTFHKRMHELPMSHPVFHAFYDFDRVPAGDIGTRYPLKGIDQGGRTIVIYSRNDYGDCWEGFQERPWLKDTGNKIENAFRLAVNFYVYAVAQWKKHGKGR